MFVQDFLLEGGVDNLHFFLEAYSEYPQYGHLNIPFTQVRVIGEGQG